MNDQNLDDLRKGKIHPADAAENYRDRQRQRRPTSHKSVLVLFALTSIAGFTMVAELGTEQPHLRIMLAACAIPVVSVMGILALRLSKLTYLFTTAALLLSVAVMGWSIARSFDVGGSGAPSDKAGALAGNLFGLLIFALVLWRYTFGHPSRAYYGLAQPIDNSPPITKPRQRGADDNFVNY